MWRRYYHVTTENCVEGIIELGLDPGFSRGKRRAVWLVDSKRLMWAIAHVSARRDVSVNKLWIVVVHVDPRELNRNRWRGVYFSRQSLRAYELLEVAPLLARGPIRLSGERG